MFRIPPILHWYLSILRLLFYKLYNEPYIAEMALKCQDCITLKKLKTQLCKQTQDKTVVTLIG